MAHTASDVFVERLMEWGVDTVFGLPGDGINGFVEALRSRHDELRHIHVRHACAWSASFALTANATTRRDRLPVGETRSVQQDVGAEDGRT